MKIVKLQSTKVTQYGPVESIMFHVGVPKQVSDSVAERVLSTGHFTSVDPSTLQPNELESHDALVQTFSSIGSANLNEKRVLLCRHGAIGDVLFVVQVAAYLKSLYPKVNITLGVRDRFVAMCSAFDHITAVTTVDSAADPNLRGAYDYVVDFTGVVENAQGSGIDYYRLHWDHAGIQPQFKESLRLPLCTVSKLIGGEGWKANYLLRHAGINTDEPYIVILTSTGSELKTPPLKLLQQLAEALTAPDDKAEIPQIKVLCLAGPQTVSFDTPLLDGNTPIPKVASDSPWICSVNGETFVSTMEIIRRATLVIGGDTGFTHYAMAIGVPTVSLWGPTDPKLTMPHVPRPDTAIAISPSKSLPCCPCNQVRTRHCEHFTAPYADCMRQIELPAVVETVRKLLGEVGVKAPSSGQGLQTRAEQYQACTPDAARAQYDGTRFNVAVLLDNLDCYFGGGFHAWHLSHALAAKAACHVWIVSDQDKIVYMRDASPLPNVTVVADPTGDFLAGKAALHFDVVIGTPMRTGIAAVDYAAQREDSQSVCLLYETPNFIREFRKGRDGEDSYWEPFKQDCLDKVDIIWCISRQTKEHLYEWDSAFKDKKVEVVSPVVDSDVADSVLPTAMNDRLSNDDRHDAVVLVGRNVEYKRLEETIDVVCARFALHYGFSPLRPFTLYVMGTDTERLLHKVPPKWAQQGIHVRALEKYPESQKWKLLRNVKAVVHPSTFEGFGLPPAEAMYAGTPVIARRLPVLEQAYGDHPYYFSDDDDLVKTLHHVFTAWDAISDAGESNTVLLRFLYDAYRFVQRRYTMKTQRGRVNTLFARYFRDAEVAAQSRVVAAAGGKDSPRVAIVSPWGVRCGIAETTAMFTAHLSCGYRVFAAYEDSVAIITKATEAYVTRCWDRRFRSHSQVLNEILEYAPSIVHIEHEFSLFREEGGLFEFIRKLRERGIKVVITLHTFFPSMFIEKIAEAVDLVVTTKPQAEMSVSNRVTIDIPAKAIDLPDKARVRDEMGIKQNAFVVGTYGLWNPHKGFHEVLLTYGDVSLRCGDATTYLIIGYAPQKLSYYRQTRRQFRELVELQRIRFYDTYMPYPDAADRIAACDVVCFNYNVQTHFSASAAIRDVMYLGVPVVCSESTMFAEFADGEQVLKVPFQEAKEGPSKALIDTLVRVREDAALRKALGVAGRAFAMGITPQKVAQRHDVMYRRVLQ